MSRMIVNGIGKSTYLDYVRVDRLDPNKNEPCSGSIIGLKFHLLPIPGVNDPDWSSLNLSSNSWKHHYLEMKNWDGSLWNVGIKANWEAPYLTNEISIKFRNYRVGYEDPYKDSGNPHNITDVITFLGWDGQHWWAEPVLREATIVEFTVWRDGDPKPV